MHEINTSDIDNPDVLIRSTLEINYVVRIQLFITQNY